METSVTILRKRASSGGGSKWRERARIAQSHHQAQSTDLRIEPEQESKSSVCESRIGDSMRKVVSKLPSRQRQVLQRVNEGLAYEQIAARLALSPGVVLGELSRAYSQLCIRMKREDIK